MDYRHAVVAIIPSNDLDVSQTFYERLGFSLTSKYDAQGYRILHDSHGAGVHLRLAEPGWVEAGRNPFGVYFYCEEVESLAERLGCNVENKPWGMREFAIGDPDGTLVRIGWPS